MTAPTAGPLGLSILNGDVHASFPPPVRQTVLSGPVDTNGYAAFGGSTGSTTVTAAGTLKATAAAAAGADFNLTGSIVNPSWASLSTNGTMFLYLDVSSATVPTTGSTTLAPIYQWGGTPSIVNGQHTFNIQQMTMYVGNGTTAVQVARVFVGEVTVASAVVSAIVWYALMGRYDSGFTATLPGTNAQITKTHNIGQIPLASEFVIECTTTDLGWAVGSQLRSLSLWTADGTGRAPLTVIGARLSLSLQTGSTAGIALLSTAGVGSYTAAANWKYKFVASRGW
jgi:hypothetical protein